MWILGISAFCHDSAAALMRDGEVMAAAQEKRFTRVKHDSRFCSHAVRYCLEFAGLKPDELDHVVFYEKPFLLESYLAFAPKACAPSRWRAAPYPSSDAPARRAASRAEP